MTTTRIIFMSVACLISLATASAPVFAQEAPSPSTATKEDPLAIYKSSGINQTQEGQMRELVTAFEKLTIDKAQVMIGLLRDMRQISLQVDATEQAALSKQDEINKLNNEMANERIRLMLKLRSIMTPEQRQKLVQLMQQSSPASPR